MPPQDEPIPIDDVPLHVPTPGKRIHRATGWRWTLRGLKRNGQLVVLKSKFIGGRRYTTLGDIERFLRACNGDVESPTVTGDFSQRAMAAGQILESMGVK